MIETTPNYIQYVPSVPREKEANMNFYLTYVNI